jgi:uncharacterized protein
MSKSVLPKSIEPMKLADQHYELSGVLPLTELPRMAEFTLSDQGEVDATLKFGLDEEGIRHVVGHLTCDVKVMCQRCLNEMDLTIDSNFQLAMVWSDSAANNVPTRFEPWILEKDSVPLYEVIEDEILLEIPVHATHPTGKCSIQTQFGETEVEIQEVVQEEDEKPNPFAALAQLKINK